MKPFEMSLLPGHRAYIERTQDAQKVSRTSIERLINVQLTSCVSREYNFQNIRHQSLANFFYHKKNLTCVFFIPLCNASKYVEELHNIFKMKIHFNHMINRKFNVLDKAQLRCNENMMVKLFQ